MMSIRMKKMDRNKFKIMKMEIIFSNKKKMKSMLKIFLMDFSQFNRFPNCLEK
jgi:hypothetical protein